MRMIEKAGFQGDVMFRRVASIPDDATAVVERGPIVVAHSETGHHHSIDSREGVQFYRSADPLTCYLSIEGAEDGGGCADVVHHRPTDTHETLRLPAGAWMVRRQREYTPEGWRRVED